MTTETHKFKVEVEPLMSIIVNSLYKSKDNSVRELISNASDAIDKYVSEFQGEEGEDKTSFDQHNISLKVDKATKTIEITDTGIGMTRDDLENFLGKIASSGTRAFKEMMANKGSTDDMKMIGQFGLGFYAAFIISGKVDVITKCAGHEQFKWSSSGVKDYTIEHVPSDRTHGTTIVLHVKEGEEEFLENNKIEEIIKKHSAFITYPIYIAEEAKAEKKDEEKVEEVKEENEKSFNKRKINHESPLWLKKPKDVTEEEYESFYKAVSGDFNKHMAVKHVSLDGTHRFDFLLYVPAAAPFDFDQEKSTAEPSGIKLYCANVLITDQLQNVIPPWMSFIKGVVSNKDLPVNISREFIQGEATFKVMKRMLIRKTIELFSEIMNSDKAEEFTKQYSKFIKSGLRTEDKGNQDKLIEFLRFPTSKSGDKKISFSEYISNMPEDQKQILILTGTNVDQLRMSPFLSGYENYEVIFMAQPADIMLLQTVRNYADKSFQHIDSAGVEIKQENKINEDIEKEFNGLTESFKTKFGLEKVELKNLGATGAPALVLAPQHGFTSSVRDMIEAQYGTDPNNPMAMALSFQKDTMVLNIEHPEVLNILTLLTNEDKKQEFEDKAKLLYAIARIDSGFKCPKDTNLSELIYKK